MNMIRVTIPVIEIINDPEYYAKIVNIMIEYVEHKLQAGRMNSATKQCCLIFVQLYEQHFYRLIKLI